MYDMLWSMFLSDYYAYLESLCCFDNLVLIDFLIQLFSFYYNSTDLRQSSMI